MAQGIPILKDAPYNVLTVPNYVRGLVVTTKPAQVIAAYTAPPGVEAWTVYRPSVEGVPAHPYDGWRVVTPLSEDAETTVAATLTEHIVNDTEYVVRVFIRGRLGFQTRVGGAVATATPVAGQPASVFPVETPLAIPMKDGTIQRRIVIQQGLPDAMYDTTCNGTWTLEEAIHTYANWNASAVNDYAKSSIHTYLNGDNAARYDPRFIEKVVQAKIPYVNGTGDRGSVASGTNGLSCKFFLLSGYEVGWTKSNYSTIPADGAKLDYFLSGTGANAKSKRIAKHNGSPAYWWTRSPFTFTSASSVCIDSSGDLWGTDFGCDTSDGIRDACIIPYDMLFSLTPNPDGSYSPIL